MNENLFRVFFQNVTKLLVVATAVRVCVWVEGVDTFMRGLNKREFQLSINLRFN